LKRDLVDILCCPVCKGGLSLTVNREDGKDILEGVLACGKCQKGFPIEDGIPNLLPEG
jgi:uncharacterized protein YbaR (Trm112 family)